MTSCPSHKTKQSVFALVIERVMSQLIFIGLAFFLPQPFMHISIDLVQKSSLQHCFALNTFPSISHAGFNCSAVGRGSLKRLL